MKKSTTVKVLCICLTLVISVSCKKLWDHIKDHPDNPEDKCRIEYIAYRWGEPNEIRPDTVNITYDQYNNPLILKHSALLKPIPESQNMAFKYDSQHRLIAYIEYARPEFTYGLLWHRLVYVNKTTIMDTMFVYANGDFFNTDRPDPNDYYHLKKISLDNYGRIIKIEDDQSAYPVITFEYDSKGNLIKPGVTYTNKINIKQTNRVWMFITQDYSMNAPAGEADSYNNNNLPATAKKFSFTIYPSDLEDQEVRIKYHCE